MTTMNNVDETRFHTLLSTWNQHQELRRVHAPIASLAESRLRLDSARLDIRAAA